MKLDGANTSKNSNKISFLLTHTITAYNGKSKFKKKKLSQCKYSDLNVKYFASLSLRPGLHTDTKAPISLECYKWRLVRDYYTTKINDINTIFMLQSHYMDIYATNSRISV